MKPIILTLQKDQAEGLKSFLGQLTMGDLCKIATPEQTKTLKDIYDDLSYHMKDRGGAKG